MIYPIQHMPDSISIGFQTETGVTEIGFDVHSWLKAYGSMTLSVNVTRPGAEVAYGAEDVKLIGSVLYWYPNAADTEISGEGTVEIKGETSDKRKLSGSSALIIKPTTVDRTEEAPDPIKTWLEGLAAADMNIVNGAAPNSIRQKGAAMDAGSSTLAPDASAFGVSTTASGRAAHAEGVSTTASAAGAHSEGNGTVASGSHAHAEGGGARATAEGAHAEGNGTEATNSASHAEGTGTKATGRYAHAEGSGTVASGESSHAEGAATEAKATGSHAEGLRSIAAGQYQHVCGRYNAVDDSGNYAFIVGCGTSEQNRTNGFAVDWNGNAEVGAVKLKAPDGTLHTLSVNNDGGLSLGGTLIVHVQEDFSHDTTFDAVREAILAGRNVVMHTEVATSAQLPAGLYLSFPWSVEDERVIFYSVPLGYLILAKDNTITKS